MPHEQAVQQMTNVEFVADIMEFSRYGALAQAFVIEALQRHAERIAAANPKAMDSPGLSGSAWVGVAREIRTKLVIKYGEYENNG
ncbi:hypothetical protein [Comamonas kerstersii]